MATSAMIYYGIDPGKSGGIASLYSDGTVARIEKMPETEADILEALGGVDAALTCPAMAALERVRSSPQMGVVSAFTFGQGYGALRMALAATKTPYDEVMPLSWQRALQCRSKGDKNVTKRRAQELYPGIKVTHASADALLLATYCRRKHLGIL